MRARSTVRISNVDYGNDHAIVAAAAVAAASDSLSLSTTAFSIDAIQNDIENTLAVVGGAQLLQWIWLSLEGAVPQDACISRIFSLSSKRAHVASTRGALATPHTRAHASARQNTNLFARTAWVIVLAVRSRLESAYNVRQATAYLVCITFRPIEAYWRRRQGHAHTQLSTASTALAVACAIGMG